MADPIIAIDKLRIIYNQGKSNEVRALEETNLSIFPQEYVIIYGPSGCGKSTLLYSVAGLQAPTYGDINIRGKALSQMKRKEQVELHQRGVGMVFQAFYLIESLNILDNVCLPKVLMGADPDERRAAGIALLRRFGIVEQAEKFPAQLSGGQKQRVAIARALINNPEIILADEPVGNLDSESADNVLKILKELHTIDKKTVVMVTHNPEHLVYADRVIHMKDGRIMHEEKGGQARQFVAMTDVPVTDSFPVPAPRVATRPIQPPLPPVAAPFLVPGSPLSPVAIPDTPIDLNAPVAIPYAGQVWASEKVEESPHSKEFKLLASSFRNLLPQQVDVLLIPFKAKQILTHLLSELNEEQVSTAEGFLKELLFKNIDSETFAEHLDLDLEEGGAGWNKARAHSFAVRTHLLLECAQKLSEPLDQATAFLSDYLREHFTLSLSQKELLRFQTTLRLRLESKIGQIEAMKRLDTPTAKGGVGLHKQTAEKVVREVEILMLLKYS